MISDPYKLETTLGVVRTLAPLTSSNTVNKINFFLPFVEKFSSILGMYSFINKAQNYAPIQSLGDKQPMEKVGALMNSNSLPIASMIAKPLISKNMDKIITKS